MKADERRVATRTTRARASRGRDGARRRAECHSQPDCEASQKYPRVTPATPSHQELELHVLMNRDFFSSGAYMQLTELQPPHAFHQQYELAQASTAESSTYEMTAGGAGDGEVELVSLQPAPAPAPAPMLHHQDPRKRRPSHFTDGYESMSGCETPVAGSSTAPISAPSVRKRKPSSYDTASSFEDDGDDSRSTRTLPDKKQNHSEIEKRRRDKMNTYIAELSGMVPMCGALARKLDKLSVLRMAVAHLRGVRGALSACPLAARPHAALLSERELGRLVVGAARAATQPLALLVLGCDRGRLLYLSASVADVLHYHQSELLGQSLFDILHPKDVAKVKEQLSSSDLSPRERLIDAKTMLPVKGGVGAGASRLSPGARRSFFCRIKCKAQQPPLGPVKDEADPAAARMRKKHNEKKYCVVHCTGYLKPWAPAEMTESGASSSMGGAGAGAGAEAGAGSSVGAGEGGEDDAGTMSCLVAVARALHVEQAPPAPAPGPAPPTRSLQFVSRHAIDGKYTFVDQRVTVVLGYLPQELLGTSLYEVVRGGGGGGGGGGGALGGVARAHQAALAQRAPRTTPPYAARCKDGSLVRLQTLFKPFRNPWTKEIESLVAQHTLISEGQVPAAEDETLAFVDLEQLKGDAEVQRLIDEQVESHKIGSAIAEEALRRASNDFSPDLPPDLPPDLLNDAVFDTEALMDNMLCGDLSFHVRNNVPLSAAGARSPAPEGGAGGAGAAGAGGGAGGGSPSVSPPLTLDGNGEAAMAVIMSLLEADAGLGGPVNFSGLPWPLP